MTQDPRSLLTEPVKMGSIITSQPSTMITRLVKSVFKPMVQGEDDTSIPLPWRTIAQPTKPLSTSMMLHLTAQGFGPQVWIREPAILEIPMPDLFGDWRLAIGIQPYFALDLKPCGSPTRSRSQDLVLSASFPSADFSVAAGCSTTPPIHYLVPTSPTKRNVKLQAIQAKVAKQVQRQEEAVSRANKAAQLLRDTWTHDAKYRRRINAKRLAEKAVRVCTENLHAIRKEEMDILSKLERKRRRNCERWDHAQDSSEGAD